MGQAWTLIEWIMILALKMGCLKAYLEVVVEEDEVDEDVAAKVDALKAVTVTYLVAALAERTFAEASTDAAEPAECSVDKLVVDCLQEEMDVDQVGEEEHLAASTQILMAFDLLGLRNQGMEWKEALQLQFLELYPHFSSTQLQKVLELLEPRVLENYQAHDCHELYFARQNLLNK